MQQNPKACCQYTPVEAVLAVRCDQGKAAPSPGTRGAAPPDQPTDAAPPLCCCAQITRPPQRGRSLSIRTRTMLNFSMHPAVVWPSRKGCLTHVHCPKQTPLQSTQRCPSLLRSLLTAAGSGRAMSRALQTHIASLEFRETAHTPPALQINPPYFF